ncbi:MAG TPA: hypothetical protein VF855_04655, partial [Acidimicrobiales bacterium]
MSSWWGRIRLLAAERQDSVVTVSTVGVLVLVVALPVWPGIFTVDSQVMYDDGRKGEVTNWYAPLHSWAWGTTGTLHLTPAVILLAGVTLFVTGVVLCFRLVLSPVA